MKDQSAIPSVTILLATFQGEKFLEDQLQSLASQKNVSVRVVINDDGSTDGTLDIIEKWKNTGLITKVSLSNKLGPSLVFQRLLMDNTDNEYIAFSDQDDIWDSNKLYEQIQLVPKNKPTLIFTNRIFLSKNGKESKSLNYRKINPNFRNALVENVSPGNTILINREAANKLSLHYQPDITHYDSWFYLVMSATGDVVHLDKNLVKYRLHDDNLVGLRSIGSFSPFESIRNYLMNAERLKEQEILSLKESDAEYLDRFLGILKEGDKKIRLQNLLRFKIYRQKRIDAMGMKIILFFGVLFNKI